MIRLNITQKQLDDAEEMLKIVNKILIIQFNLIAEQERLDNCFKYYEGEYPKLTSKYENLKPKVFNITRPKVLTATRTFIGTLPDIITNGNKEEKDRISIFSQKLYHRHFQKYIYETEKSASICGSGFLCLYNEENDKFPRFKSLDPRLTNVVYDCSLAKRKLFAFRIFPTQFVEGSTIKKRFTVYIYRENGVYIFQTSTVSLHQKSYTIRPYFISRQEIVNDKGELETIPSNFVKHDFNKVPIIEFPNNAEYKGDIEHAFGLIDLYNRLQNNRCQNVDDILNYVLLIKNVKLGDEKEQQEIVDNLKNNRILPLVGEDSDAKFLSNPLNQNELQTLANDILKDIDNITSIPNLSSVDFSQNASDPILKIKTKPLLDLCAEKEEWFTKPYIEAIELALNYCSKHDTESIKYTFDTENIELKYSHSLPSNDGDMITMITNLSNSGLANPEVLLQELSFIPNVSEYLKGMNNWNKEVDKRKSELNNRIKQEGLNETNLQRQNAIPLTKDKMDNKNNFDRGNAKTLSDEKVPTTK